MSVLDVPASVILVLFALGCIVYALCAAASLAERRERDNEWETWRRVPRDGDEP